MCITLRENPLENINKLLTKGYGFDYENEPVTDKISNPQTQRDIPTYNTRGQDGIDLQKSRSTLPQEGQDVRI